MCISLECIYTEPWTANERIVGRVVNVSETRKNENFTLCTLDFKIINIYEVNTHIQITFFLKTSVTETCLFRSLTFRATTCQFQVQNVLFVMPFNAVHVKELFNSSVRNTDISKTGHWFKVTFVSLLLLLQITPTIITQFIYAGTIMWGKSTLFIQWPPIPTFMEQFPKMYLKYHVPKLGSNVPQCASWMNSFLY